MINFFQFIKQRSADFACTHNRRRRLHRISFGGCLPAARRRSANHRRLVDGHHREHSTLKNNPRFQYTIDSVHNQPVTAELVDQCDVVVHLAAAVGVKLIVESPVRTIETNVRGTEVVLALANKKQKRVLVASTSEVYGLSTDVPSRKMAIW